MSILTVSELAEKTRSANGEERAKALLMIADTYMSGFRNTDIDYEKASAYYLQLLDEPESEMRDEGLDHLLTMFSKPMVYFETVPISLRIDCCRKLTELAGDDYRRIYAALIYAIQDALKRNDTDEAAAIAENDMRYLLDAAASAARLPYEESFVDLLRALVLLNGCGLPKDTAAAVELFEKCASCADNFPITPIAHKILGDLHHHGDAYGFELDWKTALAHYRKTVTADNFPPFVDGKAIQGEAFATMARMLCDGGHGLEPDLDEAELCATCASALENWNGASMRIEIAEKRTGGKP